MLGFSGGGAEGGQGGHPKSRGFSFDPLACKGAFEGAPPAPLPKILIIYINPK